MHFVEKFDGENIDRQYPRPPVLAILLETIEREILTDCWLSVVFFYQKFIL